MAMDKYEEWVCAFESKIKSKSFEQFSLLMMDFKTAKEEQRFLLYQILFENHQSPNLWRKYIEFAFKEFGGKKLYLQRLINKALELLDEKQFSNDPSFLSIHLFSIQLKSCNEEKAKYFQNILFKRSIGVGFAELFLSWAKVAPTSGSAEGTSLYTSSEVLEKGIESNAQPTIVFRRNSGMNGELSSSQTKAVDLNLELETEEVEEETTKIASTEEVRKLLHQAMSESIKPPQPHSFSVQSCSSLEANFSENLKRQKANSKSAVDVFDTKIEESSDNSGSLTMKVPTEDLQILISKLPKRSAEQNSVALISRVAETNKRRKVSFNNRGSATDLPDTILNRQDDIFLKEERYFSLKGKKYFKLSSIGKGGSSSVFKVISTNDGNVFALKTIDLSKHFEEEDEGNQVFESYANEINLLNTLRHSSPFIIELVDYQIFREERKIAMLLELGEIDLAKLLAQSMKQSPHNLAFQSQFPSLDPIYSRMLWKEMLMAVQHIHDNRIIHGDLKPANFVMVKGHLKLIDFGIAKSISVDTTNIYRDSQIGTINYMAPEAINPQFDANIELDNNFPQRKGMKIGRPSDVWSLGCILYQMIFGKPPFASLNTIQKLMAIPNSDYEIFYPLCPDSDAVETIRSCLVRNPSERARICGTEGLMKQPYLQLPAQSAKEVKQISNQKEQEYFPVNNRITRQRLLELVNMEFPSPQTRNKVARWVESLSANNFAGCDIEYENIEVAGNDYNFAEVKAPLGKRSEHLKITALTPIDRENEKHKVLPSRLRQEIMQSENRLISVQSEEAIVRASKWMKNEILEPSDMKSILEKKMVQMRKFLDVDQDNRTTTESLNLTNFYNQI